MAGADVPRFGRVGDDEGLRIERILLPLRWLAIASWLISFRLVSRPAPDALLWGLWAVIVVYGAATHWRIYRAQSAGRIPVLTALGDLVAVGSTLAVTGGVASEVFEYLYLPVLGASVRFGVGGALGAAAIAGVETLLLEVLLPSQPGWASMGLSIFLLFFVAILGGVLSAQARRHFEKAILERDRADGLLREITRARDRQQELLRRVIHAEDEERKRIAGDIHDRMGHRLSEFVHDLGEARDLLPDASREAAEKVDRIAEQARGFARDVRNLMNELRPSVLDDFGFQQALREYLAENPEPKLGIRLTVDPDVEPETPDADSMLFRVFQEALHNVKKHANARNVDISLRALPANRAELVIRDDGRGFDPDRVERGHFGLLYMRERAEACGGDLSIRSGDEGTEVRVTIPRKTA